MPYLESESLRLEVDLAAHRYRILDKRAGIWWESLAAPSRASLSTAIIRGDTIELSLHDDTSDYLHIATISLDGDSAVFDLTAMFPNQPFRDSPLASWPPAFRAALGDGRICFCDRSCGVLIGTDDDTYGGRTLRVYGNTQCLDMPWMGVMDGPTGPALMVEFATPFDADLHLRPDDGSRFWPQAVWLPVMGTFGYTRRLTLRFLPSGGYVALAKRYRSITREKGLLKTLGEKASDRPAVALLRGAPIVWGDMDAEAFVKYARATAGMTRAVLANAHMNLSDENALRRLNAMGYITTEYDSTGDITEGDTGFQRDDVEQTSYHWEPGAGPAKGWRTLEGLQYYFRSSARALMALRSYVPDRLRKFGFNGRFMDVAGAITLFEDYHPEHSFDRRQDMIHRRAAYEYFRELGVVIGTEHGNDWCADLVDYFEGSTSGPFWWATEFLEEGGWNAGHLQNPTDRRQLPAEYLRYGMGLPIRIPLWDLVYHDCACGTWYWGDTAGFMHRVAPELADRKDLYNLLYATLPLLWRDETRGYLWSDDSERARFFQSFQHTCRLHEVAGFDELLDHTFLTPDGTLQRTRFSSGTTVLVSFGEEPVPVPDDPEGRVLAPFGYLAEGPGIEQHRLWKDGTAVTWIRREPGVFMRLVTEAERAEGPFLGTGCVTAFLVDDAWHLTLEADSAFSVDPHALAGIAPDKVSVVSVDDTGAPTCAAACPVADGRVALPVRPTLSTWLLRER